VLSSVPDGQVITVRVDAAAAPMNNSPCSELLAYMAPPPSAGTKTVTCTTDDTSTRLKFTGLGTGLGTGVLQLQGVEILLLAREELIQKWGPDKTCQEILDYVVNSNEAPLPFPQHRAFPCLIQPGSDVIPDAGRSIWGAIPVRPGVTEPEPDAQCWELVYALRSPSGAATRPVTCFID
jgi:hypothetical protein